MLHHYQAKNLTGEARTLVSDAKDIYYKYLLKKAPACQESVNNFWKNLSESERKTMTD